MSARPRSSSSDDSTRTLTRPSGKSPIGAIIRVIGARATPRVFRLPSGRCVLGAGAGADVVIEEDTVSRAHVAVELVPEGVVIHDLGSRNGTHYLGQRVEKMVLGLGSRLRLGAVEIAIDADVEALVRGPSETSSAYRGLLGVSPAMQALFTVLMRLEGSLASVLIEGESGCGKELVAHAIHEGSTLSTGPLIVVNCGGIARELVLSELFGHRRGAFTGALEDRIGAFTAAHGGTLFLDEVGELPLEVQPALLRALEAGEVRPVGTSETRHVKVRIIAATNRDLMEDVRAGKFRDDLYYRLAVVKLSVPPLRERSEDIPELARHFAVAAGLPTLPDDVVARLSALPWPGNARELRNAVQAYLAIGTLPGDELPGSGELDVLLKRLLDVEKPYADLKDEFLYRFTKTYLEMLLTRTGGNQSEAARISGLDRGHLGKLLARYRVTRP